MSLQGDLEFRDANKITFIGGSSNTLIDLTTGSLGVGVTGTSLSSNLHVAGNKIKVGDNIFSTDGPHTREPKEVPLKKYPEIAFESGKFDYNDSTNTYVQAGYTVSASRSQTAIVGENLIWEAFNGIASETGMLLTGNNYDNNGNANTTGTTASRLSASDSTPYGEWLKLKLPNKIKLNKYVFTSRNDTTYWPQSVEAGQVWGSNNDSNWVHLHTFTNSGFTGASQTASFNVTTNNYYKYYAFIVTKTFAAGTDGYLCIPELEYYGYEEDPPAGDTSMDTTFTSIMNTPQTTGANVYVDAKLSSSFTNQVTGPTPVGTAATHDNTNKYWELTGELTSNITVEANTFLEGDQPHAVSVWFNSSNLEANVSNTCVFSVSDQEKLDSVNLDLQSNTWHNLTYAYQGEGGSRVTYLDGRKVVEDQAEDTFGDYPPFAMKGYTQGGYVVSVSSEVNQNQPAWYVFDNGTDTVTGTYWQSSTGTYSGGNWTGSTVQFTDTSGGQHSGEWIKLEMPHKLKLDYISYLSTYGSYIPKDFVILGSNDDTTWTLLKSVTGGASVEDVYHSLIVNANHSYKYFVWLTSAIQGSSPEVVITEIKFYGHRENDLVRLPDPTNVLKYPHITMTGQPGTSINISDLAHAQRGYTVTASSMYIDNATNPFQPWRAFNNETGSSLDGTAWVSTGQTNTYGGTGNTYGTVRSANLGSDSGGTATPENGEWLKIELPHKIVLSHIQMVGNSIDTSDHPKSFKLYGSINGTTWVEVLSVSNTSQLNTSEGTTFTPGSTPDAYNYFGLVVTATQSRNNYVSVTELKLYGTGVDSIPIQIGGGNIDRVANFRVYDKFIDENQALEIWNAQKDEFGRAKSSMTLQKGRLGLGTTEPEGRLAVSDEPHAPEEEFPPRAGGFDGDEWYIEGHGTFKACASNYHSITDYYPGRAFTKSLVANFGYASDHLTSRWSGNNGLPNQSSSDPVGTFQGHQGDWLELELPYRIRVKSFQIQTRIASWGPGDHPKNGFLYGSNNRENWTEITEFTNLTYTPSQLDGIGAQKAIWNVNSETGFKYLRLLTTQKIDGSDAWLMISELKYFGTREQGQSVLHDGQLTLMKSLNVPRIGSAVVGNDSTPRRDRLIVEYNTSTNPTFEGVVRDTSMGKKFDARIIGNAHYNATIKTFEGFGVSNPIDANGDYLRTDISTFRGNVAHSHSVWIRMYYDNNTWTTAINLGSNYTSNQSAVTWEMNNDRLWWNTYSGGIFASHKPQYGRWYHIVTTHNGEGPTTNSTTCIYIDGVKQSTTDGTSGISGTGGTLNITGDYLTIGAARSNNDDKIRNPFNGQIASYKLYDIVLTPQEVKDLYDMGHCEEGNNVINIEKTRVGIGLGDGVSPHEELDVRGDIRASDNLIIGPYGEQWWKLWTYQHNGNLGFIGEDGTEHGYLVDSGTESNLDFTGQHRSIIDKINVSDYENLEGLIVSANKNKYVNVDKDITTGSNAIQISQSLPVVSLSNVVHDKACYGVIAGSEDPDSRTYEQGTFVSVFQKQKGDTRAFINSVGEGAIWVVNTNGSLESGDYITTSNVAGYGQKQDSEFLANYTVAKITMDCDFEPETQPIQIIKKDEEGENVLDEHGQIQWEDHPTETERAYKVRYLTADGIQTDEANAVHIAAFVGCTYHCG